MAPKIKRRGKSWHAVVWLGRDADGKPIRQSITRPTKREVQEEIDRIRAEYSQGTYVRPNKMTVKEFLEMWLERYPIKSPTTRESYEMLVREHFIPELGHIRLQELSPMHLQEYYKNRLERGRVNARNGQPEGLSPTTVLYHHRVLSRALTMAWRWRLVAQNVAKLVEPPKKRKYRPTIWTPEEAVRFLEVIAQHRLFALYVTAMLSGLRRGEIFGLKWSDVDLERRILHVRREMLMIKTGEGRPRRPVLSDELKSDTSHRTVAMSETLTRALLTHKEEQEEEKRVLGSRYMDEGLVFCRPDGGRYHLESISRTQFNKLQEQAGVPRIRFHDLRHTHASWMLANGVHPKVVSERLGHSSITITMDTYSHVIPGVDREAAEGLDVLLEEARKKLRATNRDKTHQEGRSEKELAHR